MREFRPRTAAGKRHFFMRIIRDFPAKSAADLALTIGNFDGVHRGHRHLFAALCDRARDRAGSALRVAAMTFEPHPLAVLRPQQELARLGSRHDKMHLLSTCGIEVLFVPRFNSRLANLPAQEFAEMLFANLRVRHLLVGENFRFGKGGRGDLALLQHCAAAHAAQVEALPLLHADGAPVSSGRVRQALQQGEFAQAEQLLGRAWQLRGRVQRGKGMARQWGFPTANLAIRFNPPLRGIFTARAQVGGGQYAAAVSIGTNPTVCDAGIVRVEAHLLDFNADLYGSPLRLHLLHKLREEQHFADIDALKKAITEDIAATRARVSV